MVVLSVVTMRRPDEEIFRKRRTAKRPRKSNTRRQVQEVATRIVHSSPCLPKSFLIKHFRLLTTTPLFLAVLHKYSTMKFSSLALLAVAAVSPVAGEFYIKENFNDDVSDKKQNGRLRSAFCAKAKLRSTSTGIHWVHGSEKYSGVMKILTVIR